ncbi:unnamed protein product [Spirodela intermedia]|uniref:K Homology domain-containing protein n=1 Tax=Spirodela intermedia TaxID=51605 RepID=A0A7I8J7Q3_SPIIN|nr:unnamed protein product [Spirodela intermedia]CAA6665765.1 unnamed protein product [Spirodela intermedia]
MERSRSKRGYYYEQDSDSQASPPPPPRTKGSFRILCSDEKAGSVIGKSGCFLKTFRQETGAWISVHPLAPGDDELIIETSDSRRREPDGRPPQYSPAQEALLMIHERILDAGFEMEGDDEDDEGHVGCLMGKGGKIIEQMRIETKTHIRILPRDHNTPRCVSMSEEVVQVVGESNAVKRAVEIISSRLKESLHRDRGPFRGRPHSPERYFPPDDEFALNLQHRPDELDLGPRSLTGVTRSRNTSYPSRSSAYPLDFDVVPTSNHAQPAPYEDLVFRMLCPSDKVESIMGDSSGILEMLRADVGVEVHVTDPVPGSDERIITVTSEEGPNDDLFPAQEALLHIQSHMVELGPEKDNIATTRLLISTSATGCLQGRDGTMGDLRRLTHANVQILPREEIPSCANGAYELLQIVGEIRAAREALIQITARLRSFLYHDVSSPKELLPPPVSASGHSGSTPRPESGAPNCEVNEGSELPPAVSQEMKVEATAQKTESVAVCGCYRVREKLLQTLSVKGNIPQDAVPCGNGSLEHKEEGQVHEEEQQKTGQARSTAAPPAQKTLEVSIPEQAVPSLIMRSGHKLAQIGELSLIEGRPEQAGRVVQICGSPEQAERAQSLLQGFILSTL